MWLFGLSSDKLSIGCGGFQHEKKALVDFRSAMLGSKGTELIPLTTELRAAGN